MSAINHTPRVCDNDRDEITITLDGKEIRGWSYADETERRVKMLAAREFCEGWFQAEQRPADPETKDALRKLVNEVAGLAGFGPEIKALIGVTNWNVLEQRVQEARQALSKAETRP